MQRPQGPALQSAILDEARQLLLAEGSGALSTRRIARAVGCTATSIYLYFENKEALLYVLVDEGFELLHGSLESAYREASEAHPAGEQRLRALARAYVAFGLQQPAYYEVMFRMAPEPLSEFPNDSYVRARRSLELIGRAIDEARTASNLEPVCSSTAATLLWSSLHGLLSLLSNRRIDQRLDPTELLELGIEQACRIPTAPHWERRTSA